MYNTCLHLVVNVFISTFAHRYSFTKRTSFANSQVIHLQAMTYLQTTTQEKKHQTDSERDRTGNTCHHVTNSIVQVECNLNAAFSAMADYLAIPAITESQHGSNANRKINTLTNYFNGAMASNF
jgi:hypothetical protein